MKPPSSARRDEAVCPSCERFIGPLDACPYCGTDSARNPAFRHLRWAALALAAAGLVFLYLMSARRDVPVVKCRDITPLMNFAHVRVQGAVLRDAHLSRQEGRPSFLAFDIDDGTGRLSVTAYGRVAEEVEAKRLIPSRGADVRVDGSLNVSADGRTRLRLESARHIEIRAPPGDAARPPR